MTPPTKCLIVDDTAENLVAMQALLRRDDLEILLARSGHEALELLLVHDVALALLDVQMADMDGFELAELMRGAERTKHVPIIFVTAGSRDPQRVFQGYETGAVDFLFKPIEPHVLRSKVDVFVELYAQRRELAEALRLNEMFIAILGHDLRNPLGAMLTGAQALELKVTDPNQRRTLARMISAGQRMTEMIEELLDLTRARLGGGLGFARGQDPLDVGAIVRRAVDELKATHGDREVQVTVRGDAATAGDPDRLVQMFSNLIGNALDHGTDGTAVTIAVEGGEQEIVARVHNHGAIPPHMLPTLFNPFHDRTSGAASRSHGLGLGLFIAQQIALAHKGRIDVVSSEVSGTTLTVCIPRAAADGVRSATAG